MRVSTIIIILALIIGGVWFAYKKGYIGKVEKAAEESFSLHFSSGQALYQGQKYEEAIKELEKAYQLEPQNPQAPDALVRIGDCYKELKQSQKAIEMYERVLKDYPNYKMRGQVEQSLEKVRSMGYF